MTKRPSKAEIAQGRANLAAGGFDPNLLDTTKRPVSVETKGDMKLFISLWLVEEMMQKYYLRRGKLVRLKRPRRVVKAA